MKKPRQYKKGKFQHAGCLDIFKTANENFPRSAYVNCDELTAKDARKLSAWLIKAAKWIEEKK